MAALAVVLALGTALRFWKLGRDELWSDEVLTVFFSGALGRLHLDVHPPLYYALVYVWMWLVHPEAHLLRLPSAFLGALGIAAVYGLANTLYGRRAGVFSAMLVAVSVMHVWYAQDARMYTLLVLLATLSTWALLRMLRDSRWQSAALYFVPLAALLLTHLFGLMTFGVHGLFVLYSLATRRLAIRAALVVLATQLAAVACLLPWLLYIVLNPGTERIGWVPPMSAEALIDMFELFASGSYPLGFLLLGLAALGSISLKQCNGTVAINAPDGAAAGPEPRLGHSWSHLVVREDAVLMLMLLFVPVVATVLVSILATPMFVPRFLIACSLPFYILAGRGIARIAMPSAQAAVVVAILALSVGGLWEYYASPRRPSWQSVVTDMVPRVQHTDLLVFQGAGPEVFDFYAARQGALTEVPRLWIRTNARPLLVEADQALADALEDRPDTARFWLIQFGDSGDPSLNRFVRQRFMHLEDRSVAGIRVRLFRVRR